MLFLYEQINLQGLVDLLQFTISGSTYSLKSLCFTCLLVSTSFLLSFPSLPVSQGSWLPTGPACILQAWLQRLQLLELGWGRKSHASHGSAAQGEGPHCCPAPWVCRLQLTLPLFVLTRLHGKGTLYSRNENCSTSPLPFLQLTNPVTSRLPIKVDCPLARLDLVAFV